jgi:tetratricopeptide (TPR) repeat protein/tRNA A-37 threonylcarbamoyl transferase component Bud32
MNGSIDILRGELERLFSLEEMTAMSERLLGLSPDDVGGATAKASFARALTERCLDGDRLEALIDVLVASRKGVDPRVRDLGALLGTEELQAGEAFGPFSIQKKIGESELAFTYLAQKAGEARTLKILRRETARDRRAVHRFLTANRLVATVEHPGLPKHVEAGEIDGRPFIAYAHVEAQTLAARLARTGPSHLNELKAILRGILEPLAALHKAQLPHGDLKLENILVGRGEGGEPHVTLIDFGTDKLRQRSIASNGHTGLLAVFGSPKTIAPELVRGRAADPRSDVYAFGAVLFELLSGKPVFLFETASDGAFSHLTQEPEPPSSRAPRGWIARDIDSFVLSLLQKDPAARPKDASAVLEQLDAIGRTAAARTGTMSEERLTELVDNLVASPSDSDAAIALEAAVEEGADATKVADAFAMAADQVETGEGGEAEARETKKALLFRAARILDRVARNKERAEKVYAQIVELDAEDEIAESALEDIRKALGKYEEVVEMLVARSERAAAGEPRARALAEIGRLYEGELGDPEQALVAFTSALCEHPSDEIAGEIEQLAKADAAHWNEVLTAVTDGSKNPELSQTDRNALLVWAARWYEQKVSRPDMALMAYQQILTTEPSSELASEGLTHIYRRAQQWPELAAILLARADAAPSSPRARDLRTEAAELFEAKLGDVAKAKALYAAVLADDPGHARAGDALAKIAERSGDFDTLVKLLEKRAESRRGGEKVEALVRIAEVYEDHLSDLAEATRRFEAALAIDAGHLGALKGLDRIFNRTGKYRELLENLDRQVQLAATPRQKIALYERIAALHDEEFFDHEKASASLEAILAIDPNNDHALTALARHYRAMDRWEDLQKLLEKHAQVTGDDARRIELSIARARVLADQIGSPERAMKAYEQVLERSPANAAALEALARLRELSGDAHAALSAIEALAAKATTPEAKAEQWMRAGRLLEARGDRDGAIERFKIALDANPKDPAAAVALRQAYAARGDVASVVTLIEKELTVADGNLAKARLSGELAKVLHHPMGEIERAEIAAKRALDLDATNVDALMVMGDIAFDAGRFVEASKYYETLIARASVLAKEDAVRVLVQYCEAQGKLGQAAPLSTRDVSAAARPSQPPPSGSRSTPPLMTPAARIQAAVEMLEKLATDDPSSLLRAAKVAFESGEPDVSRRMFERLLEAHGKSLSASDRADALYRVGESARRAGDLDAAIAPLKEAADLDPSDAQPLASLAKVYEERGAWDDVIKTKQRRLEVASGAERFELLLEIGDIEVGRLGDRGRASKTYVTALEERPDDRKLLTKLMQLYSEEKDWAKLVEVVLRLADFVEDAKQRAKYMHTAAIVASRQIGDIDQAIRYYDRALEADPTLAKALDEAIELRRQKADHDGVERLLKVQLDQAKAAADRVKIPQILDQLGEIYRKFLSEPELAIDAYEAAQAFDPDDRQRAEILAELYASDPEQYLDKAVKAQAQILRRNPYRVESYKLLRKLYTDAKHPDSAWCLCQALTVLNLAEPDEERFYKRLRSETAAPAQAALDDSDWTERLAHPDLDPIVTKIFALVQPTIIRTRAKSFADLGYDASHAVDLTTNPYPVAQTLFYAQGVFGFEAPPVVQNTNDPSGLGFLHATTPSILLGAAAFEAEVAPQALAFLAGRHLTYFRAGYYVRHLVPTGTGLKAWLFAAIKMCVPQFPIAPDLQGPVQEAIAALTADFDAGQKERLASLVSKLLQSGGALDLKKWVAAVDFTADRAGFVLAHDLEVASEVIRATEDAASVPSKERAKELVLFGVSEEYFAIREKLQITID